MSTTCIILAAGRGSRLKPLTDSTPKPLLEVGGVTLIEYNLQKLSLIADKFIIVTNYLEDLIQSRIGHIFNGKKVEYVHQTSSTGGTLDAFRTGVYGSIDFEKNSNYLISNSDDLHGSDIYQQFELSIGSQPEFALVSAKILEDKEKLKNYGVLEVDNDNILLKVWEKPRHYVSSLVNTGIYYFPFTVLDFLHSETDLTLGREEYITEDLFNPYSRKHPIKVLSTKGSWLPISTVHDLNTAVLPKN